MKKYYSIRRCWLAYNSYRLLQSLRASKLGFLFGFHNKLSDAELLFRKVHDFGYKYFFQKLDLTQAYKLRIEHVLRIEQSGNAAEQNKAGNYLNIVGCEETCEVLGIDGTVKDKLLGRANFVPLFRKDKVKTIHGSNILLCGPAADPQELDFTAYDYVMFNKPYPFENFGIEAEKIILILNNQWSLYKRDAVCSWADSHKKALVISPNRLGIANEINDVFDRIPMFPFPGTGFMGLQRALVILLSGFDFESIHIEGFDFSLSSIPYRSWYPSLLKEHHGKLSTGLLRTNMVHDFLLNFIFVKRLISCGKVNITGSVLDYTSQSLDKILNMFADRLENIE